jgi:hypothetical protein
VRLDLTKHNRNTEAANFYFKLYSLKPIDSSHSTSFLSKLNSKLSDTDKLFRDRPLTKEEVYKCMQRLPNGKAPGIDGLPVEFYTSFWPLLSDHYMSLLLECFQDGVLPISMRTSIITVILKKYDRKNLKNYRPISLLCADYKIIAKVFAERMKTVLPKMIHPDQTGFVPIET